MKSRFFDLIERSMSMPDQWVPRVLGYLIMRQFITRSGSYHDVGFTDRDMYNLCSREKRKVLSNGDASTTIGIMKMRNMNDPNFF
jgi:hypothetical protein